MGQREEQIQDQQLYDELLEELIEDEKLEDAPRAVIDGALRGTQALSVSARP